MRQGIGRIAGLLMLGTCCALAAAQLPDPPSADRPATEAGLAQRQQAIRERLARLEATLLNLSRALAEREPDKAERLRDALELVGQQQLRGKLDRLVAQLRSGELADADRGQLAVLADLEALLTALTSAHGDLDRRRAERKRLEELKRELRGLFDRQAEALDRTRALDRPTDSPAQPSEQANETARQPGAEGEAPAQPDDEKSTARRRGIQELEREQRALQRQAEALQRNMRRQGAESPPDPGADDVERAGGQMGDAADRLAEPQPAAAAEQQEEALKNLQQAMDQLEDALRQVRREETAETLAALQIRFRALLERELQILETIRALDSKGAAAWTRADQLLLGESTDSQRGALAEVDTLHRILLDEGTTVILPELTMQLRADVSHVADRLDAADTGPATQQRLEEIADALREILGAIEAQREEQERQQQEGEEDGSEESQPLLPGSAELKLLRGAQVRIHQRTQAVSAETAETRESQLATLAERQKQLAETARRMNERR